MNRHPQATQGTEVDVRDRSVVRGCGLPNDANVFLAGGGEKIRSGSGRDIGTREIIRRSGCSEAPDTGYLRSEAGPREPCTAQRADYTLLWLSVHLWSAAGDGIRIDGLDTRPGGRYQPRDPRTLSSCSMGRAGSSAFVIGICPMIETAGSEHEENRQIWNQTPIPGPLIGWFFHYTE